MKKLSKYIALMLVFLLIFSACGETKKPESEGKKQTTEVKNPEEKKEDPKVEPKPEEKKEDPKVEPKPEEKKEDPKVEPKTDDKVLASKDGVYYSSLMDSKKEMNDGMIQYVGDVKIEDDRLFLRGSLMLEDDVLDVEDYYFEMSEKVSYQLSGGPVKPENIKKEEFIKTLDEAKESGLGLVIEVKKGKVTLVQLSS